jgi:enterochelin esterase family protein
MGRPPAISSSPEMTRVAVLCILLFVLVSGPARAAGDCLAFELFRDGLSALPETQRPEAIDRYLDCVKRNGHPLVEAGTSEKHYRVTFLFRGEAKTLTLPGDMNGWNRTSDVLARIDGTDLYFRSYEFPAAVRLDYKFFRDGREWLLDPLNPRTMIGGYGPNSHFWLPGYVPPEGVAPIDGVPSGKVERFPFRSEVLGNRRLLHVYLPPGYEEHPDTRFPVLYLLDGEDFLTLGAVAPLMNWGIHTGRLAKAILVMVPPVKRDDEYEEKFSRFEKFVLKELVPAIDGKYRTVATAGSRGVMGVSLGGYAALNLAARNPKVFGRCGAQSTGNRDPRNLDKLLRRLERLPVDSVVFHVDTGLYDLKGNGWSLLDVTRRLRAVLEKKRLRLQYKEVPEGHSWGNWRARFVSAAGFFWPPSGGD